MKEWGNKCIMKKKKKRKSYVKFYRYEFRICLVELKEEKNNFFSAIMAFEQSCLFLGIFHLENTCIIREHALRDILFISYSYTILF